MSKINLEKSLSVFIADQINDPSSNDISTAINKIETELLDIQQQKINVAIMRSRANWAKFGEKNSKLFFSLEKRNYLNKNMRAVMGTNGQLCKQQDQIMAEQLKFYETLYQQNSAVIFNLKTAESDTNLLNSYHQHKLKQGITIQELENSLKLMPNGKCPGLDSLSKEFYETSFQRIEPITYGTLLFQLSKRQIKQICPIWSDNTNSKEG